MSNGLTSGRSETGVVGYGSEYGYQTRGSASATYAYSSYGYSSYNLSRV